MRFNLRIITNAFRQINKLAVILTTVLIFGSAIFSNAATGLDTSFGTSGKIVFRASPNANGTSSGRTVAIDANGKILAGGSGALQGSTITGFAVARFNADGTPDTGFGGGTGYVLVGFSSGSTFFNSGVQSIAFQSDGKIILAGYAGSANGSLFAVVTRLNTDGTVDSGFAANGSNVSQYGGTTASFNSVVVLPDNSIYAAGSASVGGSGRFLLAKLTAGGALDTTFGTSGSTTTSFTGNAKAVSMAVNSSNGTIVLGGDVSNDCALARYASNGALDTAFGTGGKVVAAIVANNPDNIYKVFVSSSGVITALGTLAPAGLERHLLLRFTATGAPDPTFGTNGVAGGFFGNNQEFLYGGAQLANGKIIAVGFTGGTVGSRLAIARYNADGAVDRSFGCAGILLTTPATTSITFGYEAAVQTNGRVVAVGQGSSSAILQGNIAVFRYLNPSTPTQCAAADFDADGITDICVIRPNNNGNGNSAWYRQYSSGASSFFFPYAAQFGLNTDKYAPADYDGDSRTDIAVWREAEGNFYILNSATATLRTENFGLPGDKLTVGDWDGDGKADLSVYREGGAQSFFYYRGSLNNPSGNITYLPWGTAGDKPLHGDFDGDSKQDAAVYRASNQVWYIRNSSNGQASFQTFGLSTDSFVPADYDGDGKTDVAVFRPSNSVWYILQSSNNQVRYETFGLSTDNLTPADYDGDGRADVSVFRNGVWYILQSSNNQVSYQQFGQTGDKPVQADLMP